MSTTHQWLYDLYTAFNARNIPAILSRMTPDVDWPNGMEGGRVKGQDAVQQYWRYQWTLISPTVTPLSIHLLAPNILAAKVLQEVRDLTGKLIHEGIVYHVYTIKDGLIDHMEIRQEAP